MSYSFSPRVLDALAKMKWTGPLPGRAELIEPKLKELGHVMTASAAKFLDEFGNLFCLHGSPYHSDPLFFHTDAEEAAIHIHRDRLVEPEMRVGSKLTPIGECGYGFFSLLMDEHERAFAVNQHGELTLWAESIEELITGLCVGGRMEPVEECDRWPCEGESGEK